MTVRGSMWSLRTGRSPVTWDLTGMRERAELAGGWLNVASSAGEGCEVEFWLPTSPNAALDAVEEAWS